MVFPCLGKSHQFYLPTPAVVVILF